MLRLTICLQWMKISNPSSSLKAIVEKWTHWNLVVLKDFWWLMTWSSEFLIFCWNSLTQDSVTWITAFQRVEDRGNAWKDSRTDGRRIRRVVSISSLFGFSKSRPRISWKRQKDARKTGTNVGWKSWFSTRFSIHWFPLTDQSDLSCRAIKNSTKMKKRVYFLTSVFKSQNSEIYSLHLPA